MTSDRKSLPIRLQEARAKKLRYQEIISKSNYKTGTAKKERNARTHALCQIGGVLASAMDMHPADINAENLSAALLQYHVQLQDRTISIGEYLRILCCDLKAQSE